MVARVGRRHADINGLRALAANDVWMTGDVGAMFHYHETAWASSPSGTPNALIDVCPVKGGGVIEVGPLAIWEPSCVIAMIATLEDLETSHEMPSRPKLEVLGHRDKNAGFNPAASTYLDVGAAASGRRPDDARQHLINRQPCPCLCPLRGDSHTEYGRA